MVRHDMSTGADCWYRERLTPPWWGWPVAVALASLFAAELALGAVVLRHPLAFAVAAALALLGVARVGRVVVEVTPAGLRVDDALLPGYAIATVSPVTAAGRRYLLGPGSHPLAFVIQRPWIGTGVRVDLDDPTDPTPYWFLSSRDPDRLAAAIRRLAAAARSTGEVTTG